MIGDPKQPSDFRDQAARARRLAAMSTDQYTQRQLSDFADECDRHADALDRDRSRIH